MASFRDFTLSPTTQAAIEALGFSEPTAIQSKAIPDVIAGKDVIGLAQTGTGKTAAFCIPILERFHKDTKSAALILAPTRELAVQIEEFWIQLTKNTPQFTTACLIGGASMRWQAKQLARRPRMIIATPGRLIDFLENQRLDLTAFNVLVLDEADRMLDMGFAPQLARIRTRLSTQRQTLFFTATWDSRTERVAAEYLKNPVRVSAGTASHAAPTIVQEFTPLPSKLKNDFMLEELNSHPGSTLVFARTQVRTERLFAYLESYGYPVARIHGGRSQGQRNTALSLFREGRVRVLVATDVASRGIDVPEIEHVINYDLPQVPEDYIHRIGRTGRAGKEGKALAIVSPEENGLWNQILRHLKKTGSPAPLARPRTRLTMQAAPIPADMSSDRSEGQRRSRPQAGRSGDSRRSDSGSRFGSRSDSRRSTEPRRESSVGRGAFGEGRPSFGGKAKFAGKGDRGPAGRTFARRDDVRETRLAGDNDKSFDPKPRARLSKPSNFSPSERSPAGRPSRGGDSPRRFSKPGFGSRSESSSSPRKPRF
jgi:superfamily II DNA/RNA helicase